MWWNLEKDRLLAQMWADGKPIEEIAQRLATTARKVSSRACYLRKKLGVQLPPRKPGPTEYDPAALDELRRIAAGH